MKDGNILLAGLFLFLIITSVAYVSRYEDKIATASPTNYRGMVAMGVYPNAESRMPLEGDEAVLKIISGDKEYFLYKSNHLETRDFGKTFVVRVR